MVPEARNLSCFAAAGGRDRARPCRIGRCGLTRSHHHQPSRMGHWLPACFRDRHHCRDDADYHSDRSSVHLHAEAFCALESSAGDSVRSDQSKLWTVPVLPNWDFRGVVHRASELGASLKHPCCQFFRGDLVFGTSILSEINRRRSHYDLARAAPKRCLRTRQV